MYDVPLPPDRHICLNHPCWDTLMQCVHVGHLTDVCDTLHSWCACHMHNTRQLLSCSQLLTAPTQDLSLKKPPGSAKGAQAARKKIYEPSTLSHAVAPPAQQCCCCSMVQIHHTHSHSPSLKQPAVGCSPVPPSVKRKTKPVIHTNKTNKKHTLPQQDASPGASKQLRSQTQHPRGP